MQTVPGKVYDVTEVYRGMFPDASYEWYFIIPGSRTTEIHTESKEGVSRTVVDSREVLCLIYGVDFEPTSSWAETLEETEVNVFAMATMELAEFIKNEPDSCPIPDEKVPYENVSYLHGVEEGAPPFIQGRRMKFDAAWALITYLFEDPRSKGYINVDAALYQAEGEVGIRLLFSEKTGGANAREKQKAPQTQEKVFAHGRTAGVADDMIIFGEKADTDDIQVRFQPNKPLDVSEPPDLRSRDFRAGCYKEAADFIFDLLERYSDRTYSALPFGMTMGLAAGVFIKEQLEERVGKFLPDSCSVGTIQQGGVSGFHFSNPSNTQGYTTLAILAHDAGLRDVTFCYGTLLSQGMSVKREVEYKIMDIDQMADDLLHYLTTSEVQF